VSLGLLPAPGTEQGLVYIRLYGLDRFHCAAVIENGAACSNLVESGQTYLLAVRPHFHEWQKNMVFKAILQMLFEKSVG
jgi:hypothetical protein